MGLRNRSYAIGLAILGTFFGESASSQQLTPLRVEDLLDARQFGALSPMEFSPDAKWLAFGVIRSTKDSQKTVHTEEHALLTGVPLIVVGQDIWIVGTGGEGARNLTAGEGNNWGAKWSPDGRYLAFLSDRDDEGQPKVWIWEVEANNFRKVSDAVVRGEDIQWLKDSRSLLVTLLPEHLTAAEYAKRLSRPVGTQPEKVKVPGSTVSLYRSPIKSDDQQVGPWSLDYALLDLGEIEISTGKVNRIEKGRRISQYALSPSGTRIAFTSPKRFERPGSQQTIFDIVTLDLVTKQERVVASDVRLDLGAFAFSWSPDSSLVVYEVGGIEENGDLYVVSFLGGESRNITRFPKQQLRSIAWPPLWDASGKIIYFISRGAIWRASVGQSDSKELARIPRRRIVGIVNQGRGLVWSPDTGKSLAVLTEDSEAKQSGVYKLDLEGAGTIKLLEDGRCVVCGQLRSVVVSSDGRKIAYFASDAEHDNDLWLTDANFKEFRRLTHINPQFDNYQMGVARLVAWRGLDGESLKGALLLPAGYIEGRRYPLIVSVYGGALGSNLLGYFGLGVGVFNWQLLATRGYAVLLPDAPQHLGTPMLDLAKTVLPGVSRVVEMGIADPERLGIIGHSYGGYSALALIAQTKEFKAAVMSAGAGDLTAEYGEMAEDGSAFGIAHLEQGQGLMGGTPWQSRERYIENSPIFYLDRVETPLLIVHGGADHAVDPFLAAEVFVGLRRLGKEVVFAKYEGEDHAEFTWGYANQLDFCNRMIAWFDDHLKNPEGQPAEKPKPN